MQDIPMKKYMFWAVLALIIFLLSAMWGWQSTSVSTNPEQKTLKPAPQELMTALEDNFLNIKTYAIPRDFPSRPFLNPQGQEITINDLQSPIIVVNLWATWCPPCIKELPTLQALNEKYEDIEVIAISLDFFTDIEPVKSFLNKRGVNDFAAYLDHTQSFQADLTITGLPTTYIIGPDRRVYYEFQGDSDWNAPEFHTFFDALLNENQ